MASNDDPGKHNTFFDAAYVASERDILAEVRRETFGEDIGQFSWITADELRRFCARLQLDTSSRLLDVACGSGGPGLFIAETIGCQITGVDINEHGLAAARAAAETRGLGDRARFDRVDAGGGLPFADESFGAIISIDAMNHFQDRAALLAEWRRVLRPGGRFLFTDAVVVTGALTRDEIVARSSSMGVFIFTPAGQHEREIRDAGFEDLQVDDVTETIAGVTRRWHDARERRRDDLRALEGESAFEALQNMLSAAHTLSSERRLSRFAYCARRPAT